MIKIICVGKIKEKSLKELIQEYFKRLKSYTNIEIIEVEDTSIPKNPSLNDELKIKKKEEERVLKYIKLDDFVVVLDLKGKNLDSIELSSFVDDLLMKYSNIVFIIGGSLGLGSLIIKRANFSWCLSKLTFPHQIVRLLLLEQLYRGFKILKNEPYHK